MFGLQSNNETRRLILQKLSIGDFAPDFSLPNHEGKIVQLSKVLLEHNALLVFNIGFA